MQSAKETAANVAASAKAGMDKTKATVQEKGEKMTTRDPLQKELAEEKKQERIHDAELRKLEARDQNAATRMATEGERAMGQEYNTGTGTGTTAGTVTDEYGRARPHDPNIPGTGRTGLGSGYTG